MRKHGKILIVDDNEEILIALRLLLQDYFESIHCEKNSNLIPSHLEREHFDVYILDMNFKSGRYTGNEGIFWMNHILAKDPQAVVILITAYGDIDLAVKAIKEGATDFIQKPWADDKLVSTVLNAWRQRYMAGNSPAHKPDAGSRPDGRQMQRIIGSTPAMQALLKQVSKVAGTDANVLITGENGTGKELIAREIHRQSQRSGSVFVKVDMGAISSSLFESELFGHKKGAFTDAREDRPGRFEMAQKGTLFMDEVGNLPLELQSKLLSVLQNRQLIPVGSNKPMDLDIRLITATNMVLDRMVREGAFREDLLYRLNTINLHVPPLRERSGDIPELFRYFLGRFTDKYNKPGLVAGRDVLPALQEYHWPGNIRELEHAIEKAVIMSESDQISARDLLPQRVAGGGSDTPPQNLNLEKNEVFIIRKAIERCGGNLSQASRILGITRKTLYNKINKYGI